MAVILDNEVDALIDAVFGADDDDVRHFRCTTCDPTQRRAICGHWSETGKRKTNTNEKCKTCQHLVTEHIGHLD